MDFDFQKDASNVYAYIQSRVSEYNPAGVDDLGEPGPVKMAYAGYNLDTAGWFVLVFDRRPDAGHDGEWTAYLDDGHILDRPEWMDAQIKNYEQAIQVRVEDGSVRELPARSELGPLLGHMLIGVLQRAERDGVFAQLPQADGFRLALEDFNGSIGWDSKTGYGGPSDEHDIEEEPSRAS